VESKSLGSVTGAGGHPAAEARGLDEAQLRSLLDVGRSLVAELDLETVLNHVLKAARELTSARYAALGILDEHKHGLERFLTLGIDEEQRRQIGDLPRGRGVLGELIRNPEPLRLDEVSAHPRSYGFPPGHPPMSTFLGVPIEIRGDAWGNLYLTDKQGGGAFTRRDEELAILLADWAAIAIANARLYESLGRRHAELERVVRGLEANAAIGRAVGGETKLERVLELIAKRARALIEARTMAILLPEEDGFTVAAAAGDGAESLIGARVEATDTVAGAVFRSGSTERLSDLRTRMRHGLDGLGLDASAALLAALVFRGRPEGVIVAFDRIDGGPGFQADDELVLGSFAASAATAIATARTVESEKLHLSIEASEQERRRWARELHDETLQELGGLKVMLETAQQGGSEDLLRRALDRAVQQVDSGIRNLQGLITELRPAALDQIGVSAALDALIERISSDTEMEVDYRADFAYGSGRAPSRLDPNIENTLYRFVQEALNNSVKHSEAAKVEVRIEEGDASVAVFIRDHGRGFNPDRVRSGFGLVGMRERISLAGGSLEIDSSPGEGTTVRADVPVSRPGEADEPTTTSRARSGPARPAW
jgi:signal transduction histidine kinase